MKMILIRSHTHKPWRSRRTLDLIEAALRGGWKEIRSIQADNEQDLHKQLADVGVPASRTFVFNIAEFLDEKRKHGFIPRMLDSWGFPHLGSSADTILTGLDKGATKELLAAAGIPTPPYFVSEPGDPDLKARASNIGYPLIVKPLHEGGHVGITERSIARNPEALERAVLRISLYYQQPSLVEEFITGGGMREFSVGIAGDRSRMHLPIEIDWENMPIKTRILSYEAARKDLERVKRVEDGKTAYILNDLADRTFSAIGALDYARVDIRANERGFFILEINLMPGLGRNSFLPLAAMDIYRQDYDALIRMLAVESMERQGLEWKEK